MSRKFLVSLAKPDPRIKGMDVYGRPRAFSKNGHSFTLSDPGEARELSREFGTGGSGDIIVTEIPSARGFKRGGFSNMSPQDRRKQMKKDGWVEKSPGKWVRGL